MATAWISGLQLFCVIYREMMCEKILLSNISEDMCSCKERGEVYCDCECMCMRTFLLLQQESLDLDMNCSMV